MILSKFVRMVAVAGLFVGLSAASSHAASLNCGDTTAITTGNSFIGNFNSSIPTGLCEVTFNASTDFGAGANASITVSNLAEFGTLTMAWIDAADGTTVIDSLIVAATPAINALATLFVAPDRLDQILRFTWTDVNGNGNINWEVNTVPVPPAVLLFGSALAGIGFLSRKRKKAEPSLV